MRSTELDFRYQLIGGPSEEPITLEEAKTFLRVDFDEDDDLIASLITMARKTVEHRTRRALITQTWTLTLPCWPCDSVIRIEKPPVQSIGHVKFYDTTGVQQTISSSNYQVIAKPDSPGRVIPISGYSWPGLYDREEAIEVEFTTGYGGVTDVPEEAKQAMNLLIAERYENREPTVVGNIVSSIPGAVESLCDLLDWGQY
jgi:uncharacterized phiE125 gp8 family phage protein